MNRLRTAAMAAILTTMAAPALAVGMGPLKLEGVSVTERRGFQLTVMNSDREPAVLRTYAIGIDDETPRTGVTIWPASSRIAPGATRRVFVIAEGLTPGAVARFRVCSERADENESVTIRARVCSRIEASRLSLEAADARP